jgi:cobalt-zinc-cadmium efflux system protein
MSDGHDHHDHDHDHDDGHGPGQSHDHDHHHHGHHHHGSGGHSHAPASFGRAFALGVALNVGFVVIEAFYGFLSNSMALLADAGHNLGDVLGLVVAWVASALVQRAPTPRFSYGLLGSSILAALFNAVFLLVTVGAISLEAIQRLDAPEPVAEKTVMIVATIGIFINGATAWLFASGSKDDINLRGAFLHMAADAAVSLGVVTAGLLIVVTGKTWIDPVTSLLVVAVVGAGTWGLLRDAVHLSLAAVPPGMEPDEIRAFLAGQPLVGGVHDLHIWPMSTTETALTVHLVRPQATLDDAALQALRASLRDRFGIGHATIQVESGEAACVCNLAERPAG